MAAASSSESIDLAVPGSPTMSNPRFPARPTMARSISTSSPKNLRLIFGVLLPQMNDRTARGDSFQPGGRGPLSALARAASSSPKSTSAVGRSTLLGLGIVDPQGGWEYRRQTGLAQQGDTILSGRRLLCSPAV